MAGVDVKGRSVNWRGRSRGASALQVKVEGFAEIDAALSGLPKAMAVGVLRRVLIKAAAPVAEHARGLARVATGRLRDSIIVSTRAKKTAGGAAYAVTLKEGGSKKEARLALRNANRTAASDKSFAEVYVGSTAPYAHLVEFGTRTARAFPFLRPAWDAKRQAVLDALKPLLWAEVEKATKRLAKKRASGG